MRDTVEQTYDIASRRHSPHWIHDRARRHCPTSRRTRADLHWRSKTTAQKAIASSLKLIMRANDSDGIMGNAIRALLDLHADTAAPAGVSPATLVTWMIKFQFENDCDSFTIDPVEYAPALGDNGIARYPKRLEVVRSSLGPVSEFNRAANTERSIRALASRPGAAGPSGIARFLLRSEAIASSMIEGIAPSPARVAIAELSHNEDTRGFSDQAALVVNNIMVLHRATQEMVSAQELSTADIVSLHAAL